MKFKNILLICVCFWTQLLVPQVEVTKQGDGLRLSTEYGVYEVIEPIICDLIASAGFERLKLIHQYGVTHYAQKNRERFNNEHFNRFDHSIGVFVLLRYYGASLEEQIAGLLHDVSHTVFSHVGDFVFDSYFNRFSHQDDIHEWFLENNGIKDILKKHGYENCCSTQIKKIQRMLEQDRPDLCIDRVEYLLRGGLVDNILSQEEVMPILEDLYYQDGMWIFKNIESANKLGLIALWLSEYIFGSDWNGYIYRNAADALKRSVELGILTFDDIHFSTDDIVWQKMLQCDDKVIKQLLDKVVHFDTYYDLTDGQNTYDMHIKSKCLGINPWVKTEQGLKRLYDIDLDYAKEYKRVNDMIDKGWYLVLR